ncbi:MAG: hypothetical protein ABL879_16740, partial [Devosia sp.]
MSAVPAGQLIAVMHLEDVDGQHVNLKSRRPPLDLFLECTITAGKSFAKQGWPLLVLSDKPEIFVKRATELGYADSELPRVEHYAFSLDVPEGIRFRGSHFRLDLFAAIARGEFGPAAGFIDVDTVALNPIRMPELTDSQIVTCPQPLDLNWKEREGAIRRDIAVLSGATPEPPVWFGGEFLYGTAGAFGRLTEEFERVWPIYREQFRSLHYVGAEMMLNACLHAMTEV